MAAHHRGLETIARSRDPIAAALSHLGAGKPIEQAIDAIQATQKKTDEEMRKLEADELMTDLKILRTGVSDSYEQALAVLPKDKQAGWEEVLACEPDYLDIDEEPATADAVGLWHFLEQEVLPQRRTELKNRPRIRTQAFGEAFVPDRLEKLGRYEVHLYRKLERMLAMLIRLREMRITTKSG